MTTHATAGERAHALILAAGRGSRLRPLTDEIPKPLVEVGGYPLIAYGLGLLRSHGFSEVLVNVHHLRDRLIEALGDGTRYGVRLRYSIETELLDTGGGIRRAAKLVRGGFPPSKPLLVLNADIISEIPLDRVLDLHEERKALATLVLRDDPQAHRYGVFGIDSSGRIRRFLGRGAAHEELRELMFASVHVLSPRLVAAMPDQAFSSMHDFYPRLFERGEHLVGFLYEGPWYVVDTREDLEAVERELRARGLPRYMEDRQRDEAPRETVP